MFGTIEVYARWKAEASGKSLAGFAFHRGETIGADPGYGLRARKKTWDNECWLMNDIVS